MAAVPRACTDRVARMPVDVGRCGGGAAADGRHRDGGPQTGSRRDFLASALALAVGGLVWPALGGGRFDPVLARLRHLVDRGQLPFAALRIAQHGQVLAQTHLSGAGSVHGDSIYRLHSMTKPVVAAGVMLLVEDGGGAGRSGGDIRARILRAHRTGRGATGAHAGAADAGRPSAQPQLRPGQQLGRQPRRAAVPRGGAAGRRVDARRADRRPGRFRNTPGRAAARVPAGHGLGLRVRTAWTSPAWSSSAPAGSAWGTSCAAGCSRRWAWTRPSSSSPKGRPHGSQPCTRAAATDSSRWPTAANACTCRRRSRTLAAAGWSRRWTTTAASPTCWPMAAGTRVRG